MGLELSERVISGFHIEGNHTVEFLNLFLKTFLIFCASIGSRESLQCLWALLGTFLSVGKKHPSACLSQQRPQSVLRASESLTILPDVMKDWGQVITHSERIRDARFNLPRGFFTLHLPATPLYTDTIYPGPEHRVWRFILEEYSLCLEENPAWGYPHVFLESGSVL